VLLAVADRSARGEEIRGGLTMMIDRTAFSRIAPVSRRSFLTGAAGLAAAAVLPGRLVAADATHSFRHGDFEVLVISDGTLTLPAELHGIETPAEVRAAALAAAGVTGETITGAVNLTLLRKGEQLILFDVGTGGKLAPTAGKIEEALMAAGIAPEAITMVVFSHGHPDHVWGTIAQDGKLRFPNAKYYAAAEEWDFWMAPDIFSKLPEQMHQMASETQRHFGAVKELVTMVKPGEEIVTGIGVIDTRGHTPGHVSFEVAGGDGLIIVADAIVHPGIYFPNPEWKFGFDAIHQQAVASRQSLLDRAATDKTLLLGYHWSYPGLGYAERRDGAYIFVPAS
jgi:glyoxylase-like metal-dependent hydrolase (beta-lactamase superfamily II)